MGVRYVWRKETGQRETVGCLVGEHRKEETERER